MEIEKQDLVAGVDWDWTESVSDYPASTHQLKYLLKKGTAATITLTATADGDSHVFEIDQATTAGYAAGLYRYQPIAILLTDANDIHEVGAPGLVEVFSDLSAVSDARVHALKMVDYLRTSLETLAQQNWDSLSVEGRAMAAKKLSEVKRDLALYEREAGVRKKRQRNLIQFNNA